MIILDFVAWGSLTHIVTLGWGCQRITGFPAALCWVASKLVWIVSYGSKLPYQRSLHVHVDYQYVQQVLEPLSFNTGSSAQTTGPPYYPLITQGDTLTYQNIQGTSQFLGDYLKISGNILDTPYFEKIISGAHWNCFNQQPFIIYVVN